MALLALRLDVDGELGERWADALLDFGALSVDFADAGAATEEPRRDQHEVECAERWRRVRLTALLPAGAEAGLVVTAAARAIDEPVPLYATEAVAETDWVRTTQAQFPPIRITDRLWIVPSWCEPVDPKAINIQLDPGLAFGTGSHPTTRLCLRWLAAQLRPRASVLDYGCGSGVLAIAAAKLGAGTVSGVDIDPAAIAISCANAEANGVVASFGPPDALPRGKVDVVVANILADPLERLAPLLAERVADGGRIVLSGILEPQADGVAAAYAPWFNMSTWGRESGWVALLGVRSRAAR